MKVFLRIAIILITMGVFVTSPGWAAATDAVFLSVSGKVLVKDISGRLRDVQKGSKAAEGETVEIGDGAEATLVFFDGSTLEAKSHSRFVISALRQPAPNEKIIHFNLVFGGLLARVRKLMTANSQFEIQAGGIVCGVRGTEFSVDYGPSSGWVDLKVMEGSVWATAEGTTTIVPAGGEKKFLNGKPMAGAAGEPLPSASNRTGKSLQAAAPQNQSLALEDLSAQFAETLSVNKNMNMTVQAPVLGSSLQSNVQLMNGAGAVGIILPAIPLKLGP